MLSDDTNLFISDSNTENLFETMNEELRKLAIWFWVEGGGGGRVFFKKAQQFFPCNF